MKIINSIVLLFLFINFYSFQPERISIKKDYIKSAGYFSNPGNTSMLPKNISEDKSIQVAGYTSDFAKDINAKSFGAKADWDGSSGTDNSAVLSKILSSFDEKENINIIFPNDGGTYRFHTNIIVKRGNFTINFDNSSIVSTQSDGWLVSIYPSTLQGQYDATTRPSWVGIDKEFRTLMYEAKDNVRLKNITIINAKYSNVVSKSGGRFFNFYSCDNVLVKNCTTTSYSAPFEFWLCRNFTFTNNNITSNVYGLFALKSCGGLITNNKITAGSTCIDLKGGYPQSGKSIFEGFDTDFNYSSNLPYKILNNSLHHDSSLGTNLAIISYGYMSDSNSDIATPAIGVTKASWYGKVWGVQCINNELTGVGIGIRPNENSQYSTIKNNTLKGVSILLLGSSSNKILNNKIFNFTQDSNARASIELRGFKSSSAGYNSNNNEITGNEIYESQLNSILVSGGNRNKITKNKMYRSSPFSSSAILINSNTLANKTENALSSFNEVSENTSTGNMTDYAPMIRIDFDGGDQNSVFNNKAIGGAYSGNAQNINNTSSDEYKKSVTLVATDTGVKGKVGTNITYNNTGDFTIIDPNTTYLKKETSGNLKNRSFKSPIKFNNHSMWVNAKGKLMIKEGLPVKDQDGSTMMQKARSIATFIYDPPLLEPGSRATRTITISGANVDDIIDVSFGLDLQNLKLTGSVSAPNTVIVTFINDTKTAIDLASGNLYIVVIKNSKQ